MGREASNTTGLLFTIATRLLLLPPYESEQERSIRFIRLVAVLLIAGLQISFSIVSVVWYSFNTDVAEIFMDLLVTSLRTILAVALILSPVFHQKSWREFCNLEEECFKACAAVSKRRVQAEVVTMLLIPSVELCITIVFHLVTELKRAFWGIEVIKLLMDVHSTVTILVLLRMLHVIRVSLRSCNRLLANSAKYLSTKLNVDDDQLEYNVKFVQKKYRTLSKMANITSEMFGYQILLLEAYYVCISVYGIHAGLIWGAKDLKLTCFTIIENISYTVSTCIVILF